MSTICISGKIHHRARILLEEQGHTVKLWDQEDRPTPEELADFCQPAAGLISLWTDQIDKKLFSACPNLKVVCNYAAGHNNMNIEDARHAGVTLCYTPGVLTESTSEFTLALMLALSRKVVSSHKFILAGRWEGFDPLGHLGLDLRNKTLGIIGMGRIGAEVARMARVAFNMNILYAARSRKIDQERSLQAKKVELEYLLANSDVISVHVDLNESTDHLIGWDELRHCKPGTLLINTSRGQVINETDLIEALNKKKLAGAALDVTDPEPIDPTNPLLKMENVIVTPHIGSSTEATRKKMAEMAAIDIIRVLKGEKPENNLTKV